MPLNFLSANYPLRKSYFCVPRACLGVMGFWPENSITILLLLNLLVLIICVTTEVHAGIIAFEFDLELSLDTLCPAATSAVTLLKISLFYYYRKDLLQVFTKMREMLYVVEQAEVIEVKRKILRRHATLACRLNFMPFVSGMGAACFYNTKPIILAAYFYITGKEVVWKPPFNMTLPAVLYQTGYFPFTYIFLAYTAYVTIFLYGGIDGFFFEFCANTAALLEMLQEDLKTVFEDCKDKVMLSQADCYELEAKLISIVKRQNDIINLTRFFIKRYSIITLSHFVSAAMVIGIGIFDMMTFSGLGRIIYFLYTAAVLGQLFIYCYGGSMVAENSTSLGITLYCCDWYKCNPRLRRVILLILMRSQVALTMSVPFFAPSLVTFKSVLQASGSFIALASSFR